ncbi:MAG: acylphosphatase [Nitrososphaeria archaeon]|nr:acylphosphatase [Nitrososphaeria archaeon]MDW7987067.1 acylphosphatase [Nitrososphaerota archaeon]
MKAYLLRFYGRVQRVGFRRYIQETAQDLKLSGYIRNERDGSVTVFIQGDEKTIDKFVESARSPPPPAFVKDIELKEAKPKPKIKFFEIRYGRLADELQEGFGAMQAIFMDYWSEFRDYRQEFRDFREEFRDFRKEFREFREEFREFREEFRDYREEFRDFRKEFRDFREEFRNYVKEFRDYREEFREFRGEFHNYLKDFGDFREEFRDFVKRADENFKILIGMYYEISENIIKIMDMLIEESKKTREMIEIVHKDSIETREILNETMKILRDVASKILI